MLRPLARVVMLTKLCLPVPVRRALFCMPLWRGDRRRDAAPAPHAAVTEVAK